MNQPQLTPKQKQQIEQSIFWKSWFIPIYFIGALLELLLFRVWLKTGNLMTDIFSIALLGLGIASIIYHSKKHKERQNFS